MSLSRCFQQFALACLFSLLTASLSAQVPENVHRRSDFTNCRIRFERDKVGHVAFMGGSITEMNGYRPMVCEYLQQRFPETKFAFTDAGIASTCSTTGAMRLTNDVLSKGPVDLFFVEFAVNDDQDAAHAARECLRGMEGILRHARLHNPQMDIVVTDFVNEGMLELLQQGTMPLSMEQHERAAAHYGVTTSLHAREVAEQITAGKLTWKDYGGVHPAPRGNAIAAGLIRDLLNDCWKNPLAAGDMPHDYGLPAPLDPYSYFQGRFLTSEIQLTGGSVRETPDWKNLAGQCRGRFVNEQMICATHPGDGITVKFSGMAIGAYILAGPDAGIAEVSIDGGEFRKVDLYHRFSKGLHYPRTVMFATDLSEGDHTLVLRMSAEHAAESQGTALRALQIVAN